MKTKLTPATIAAELERLSLEQWDLAQKALARGWPYMEALHKGRSDAYTVAAAMVLRLASDAVRAAGLAES